MSDIAYHKDNTTNIATFVIDVAGPVNVIGQRFISDLEKVVMAAKQDNVRGVIIVSPRKASFLDGANLKELLADAGPSDIRHVTLRYQEAMADLARSPFPVTAVLNNQSALGGGFELLLWSCDKVFATPKSKMGLPEVNVGLFPAGGGTQALPKVIGFKAAVDSILNGRVASAQNFAETGFVAIGQPADLVNLAVNWINDNQGVVNRNYDPDFTEPNPISDDEKRKILANAEARYGISPYRLYFLAAIQSMKQGLNKGIDEAARSDVDVFAPLFVNPNTRNKIDLFFLATSLGPKLVKVDPKKAIKVDTLAVIGSGLMGSGIAQVSADKGIKVLIMDVDAEVAKKAIEKIGATLDDLVKRGKWTPARKEALMANLSYTDDYAKLKDIPLVIECVFEDLNLKKQILAKVQDVNPDIVFASNTSTLPMSAISEGAKRPEMVVGMHYFSPVPLMPLLEIIEGPQSSPTAVATAVTAGRAMGKTLILVGDAPGFYTSRTFGSYVMNGFRLAELGLSPWEVDLIGLNAGFPQGPLHIYGTAGGNVVYHAGRYMASQFPDRLQLPNSLKKLYEAGFTGAGNPSFYLDERKMTPNPQAANFIEHKSGLPKPTPQEAQDILLLGMANEAFWCMTDGVLKDYFSMDLGAVLGIGFPDCWHGPARYVSLKGVKETRDRLIELAEKFDIPGLKPAPEFDRLIACGLNSNLI